jgi:hypothetical protein
MHTKYERKKKEKERRKVVQVAKKEAKCVTQEKRAKDIVFKKLLNTKNVKVVGAKLHIIFFKNSVINPQDIRVPYCGQALQ